MTKREQDIFMRGMAIAFKMTEEFSGQVQITGAESTAKPRVTRRYRTTGPRIKWTDEQDQAIRTMTAEGKTDREIAEIVGQTESRVAVRRSKLGIKKGAGFRWNKRPVAVEDNSYEGLVNLGQKLEEDN